MEDTTRHYSVTAADLELNSSGLLTVREEPLNGQFPVSQDGLSDLAHLAEVPRHYFLDCDPELRSISFNHRLPLKVTADAVLRLTVQDTVVHSVQNPNLLPAPRGAILRTIQNSIPQSVEAQNVRVIAHAWNGDFDISVISPALECEPRPGDTVAFGINVRESTDGAVQVQGASFRLICSNGAISRTCDSRHHRLRRPNNEPERLEAYLAKFEEMARTAWAEWGPAAAGLAKLEQVALGLDQHDEVASTLRRAPFFLSLQVVNRVFERLQTELAGKEGPPTLYDLFNAMTFLGTHERRLSTIYRTRLRLGAGEFTRRESSVCAACRQLLLKRRADT